MDMLRSSDNRSTFRIFKELRGGMGIVYLALDENAHQPVALKTFQARQIEQAFKQEALLWLGAGRHQNVVTALFVDELSGRAFLGLEYIAPDPRGRNTLQHYLGATQRISIARIVCWTIDLCRGMQFLFSKGVICHRDIKPNNLMISSDGTLKVTDLGLAAVLDDAVTTLPQESPFAETGRLACVRIDKGVICGSPGYIAPEILAGLGADQRSDIYSFGVVLHQLLTNSPVPFTVRNRSPQITGPQVREAGPLSEILPRLVSVDPAGRYSAFREIEEELTRVARRLDVTVPPQANPGGGKTWADYNNDAIALNVFGEHELALGCLMNGLELAPFRPAQILNNLSISYKHLGQCDKALACLNEVLDRGDRDECTIALVNKGWTLYMMKDHRAAHECFVEATGLEVERGDAWHGAGVTLMALGCYDQADEAFEKAIALRIDAKVLVGRAGAKLALQEPRLALDLLDRALALDPGGIALAWYMKGLAHDKMGQTESALSAFREFLDRADVKRDNLNAIMHADERIRGATDKKR